MMIKLYARDGAGVLHYHEAWVDDDEIIEHWGLVGQRGETRCHDLAPGEDAQSRLDAVLADARALGFAEFDEDHVVMLDVVYKLDSWGTAADLDVRNAIGEFLNQELGWTGLGHWDGGSIGSGTMEVGCVVVDFEIAKRVIASALDGADFPKFSRIEEL